MPLEWNPILSYGEGLFQKYTAQSNEKSWKELKYISANQ